MLRCGGVECFLWRVIGLNGTRVICYARGIGVVVVRFVGNKTGLIRYEFVALVSLQLVVMSGFNSLSLYVFQMAFRNLLFE